MTTNKLDLETELSTFYASKSQANATIVQQALIAFIKANLRSSSRAHIDAYFTFQEQQRLDQLNIEGVYNMKVRLLEAQKQLFDMYTASITTTDRATEMLSDLTKSITDIKSLVALGADAKATLTSVSQALVADTQHMEAARSQLLADTTKNLTALIEAFRDSFKDQSTSVTVPTVSFNLTTLIKTQTAPDISLPEIPTTGDYISDKEATEITTVLKDLTERPRHTRPDLKTIPVPTNETPSIKAWIEAQTTEKVWEDLDSHNSARLQHLVQKYNSKWQQLEILRTQIAAVVEIHKKRPK